MNGGREPDNNVIKYLAVPSSFITEESDHAHINITPVITNVFIPSTHIFILSPANPL